MQGMLNTGVATRRGMMCTHHEGAYPLAAWTCATRLKGRCGCGPGACAQLQQGEQAQGHFIVLPLFPQMTADQQPQIVDALRKKPEVGRPRNTENW